jgi:3-methyladenine DNA glycosylase AlkD
MTKSEALAWLKQQGSHRNVEGLARYGIVAKRAFGVPMGALLSLSKKLGRDQALSLALWDSGWYEARLLAALVGDPKQVTRRQMYAWAASFENWGDCDTVCFKLFDQSPFAWECAPKWCASPKVFVKRGGFALMACLALHDKSAPDKHFLTFLRLIEKGASDERNFVKKGASWAIRAIGQRSLVLNDASLAVAKRLAASSDAACQWVGNEARRQLASPKLRSKLARRAHENQKERTDPPPNPLIKRNLFP